MKFWMKMAIVSVLGFGGGVVSVYFIGSSGTADAKGASSSNEKASEIDWNTLRELDLASGKASTNLQALNGKMVRIPGFMVPLEDDQSVVTEFLLVPSPSACIHVPPPPANQMVHVRMSGQKTKISYGPIWLQGRLRIAEINGPYGKSSFEINGEFTEPFQ